MASNDPSSFELLRDEERRRHRRVSSPAISLSFDGGTWIARDWSLGGASLDGYDGPRTPGSLLVIDGLSPAGLPPGEVRIRARVIRSDAAARRLTVAFLDIDIGAYSVLSALLREPREGP